MSMVEFSAVSKNFGATQVLHDINLKIEAGEVVVIIGPAGSGKSTPLRCINKLEDNRSGERRGGEEGWSRGAPFLLKKKRPFISVYGVSTT